MSELWGVGVGPGDPELVTLKALRVLREVDVVFVPVMTAGERGRAEAIIEAHLPEVVLHRLVFALNDEVTGPQERRRQHWDAAAATVAEHLRTHGGSGAPGARSTYSAAFATIGDPAVYSTFGYLAQGVRDALPDVEVRTVPGITAMQAAASAAGVVLVEGTEPLTLLPLSRELDVLTDALTRPGAVVAYKGGRRLAQVREALGEHVSRAVLAEHLGTPDERVRPLAEVTEDTVPYLSTIVITPPRGGAGDQL
jgi:precorrin-2/cobalt-factor-2 C20-methyltransferase